MWTFQCIAIENQIIGLKIQENVTLQVRGSVSGNYVDYYDKFV